MPAIFDWRSVSAPAQGVPPAPPYACDVMFEGVPDFEVEGREGF